MALEVWKLIKLACHCLGSWNGALAFGLLHFRCMCKWGGLDGEGLVGGEEKLDLWVERVFRGLLMEHLKRVNSLVSISHRISEPSPALAKWCPEMLKIHHTEVKGPSMQEYNGVAKHGQLK